jgi:hypothetical protein
MYIPTSFFSSQGACISASVSSISGSGLITTGTFVSASISWSYVQFEMTDKTDTSLTAFTASLNILSGSTGQAKILIVGGGGSGGNGASINYQPPSSTIPYNIEVAGGGGGGGIVYYNNFPLSSGSFEIGVANAVARGAVSGSVGRNSYVKLPNNITYAPFSTSFLTAYGGGGGIVAGGYLQLSPKTQFWRAFTTSANGANGGGGVTPPNGFTNPPASGRGLAIYDGLGGLNNADQGTDGGDTVSGDINDGSWVYGLAAGGGGTLSSAISLLNPTQSQWYISNGGDGQTFNLTGTNTVCGNGGGGALFQTVGAQVQQGVRGNSNSNTYGSGGNGYRGTNANNDGNGGVVIIAWPICLYTASVPPPEPIVLPNIITGSLTAWNYWNTYTASATSWYDSSGNGNTATIYDATDAGVEVLDSLTIISQSVQFARNKIVYSPYPMNATPSSSYSLQFYGQLYSTSSKYPLLSNSNGSWNMNFVPAGVEDASSNNYIVFAQDTSNFNQFLVPFTGSAMFSGSNLLTINVNSTARTTEVYLNTNLIATGSSTSSLGLPKAFNDGVGNNQFGWSRAVKSGPGGALIPPNTLYANVKSIAIYGKELTQSEITQNYNALTSSV